MGLDGSAIVLLVDYGGCNIDLLEVETADIVLLDFGATTIELLACGGITAELG